MVIPDGNHITRWCRAATIGEDGLPTSDAFILRPGENLSVNWLEYFSSSSKIALKGVREKLRSKFNKISPKSKLAKLNAGDVRAVENKNNCCLEVNRFPACNDKSHSEIAGYDNDDEDVIRELLRLACQTGIYSAT